MKATDSSWSCSKGRTHFLKPSGPNRRAAPPSTFSIAIETLTSVSLLLSKEKIAGRSTPI